MGGIGAPFNGLKAFATTEQLGIYDKIANAVALGTSPIVKALFDFDAAMVRDDTAGKDRGGAGGGGGGGHSFGACL